MIGGIWFDLRCVCAGEMLAFNDVCVAVLGGSASTAYLLFVGTLAA